MSKNLSKNELIDKLEAIQELYLNTESISEEMEEFVPEDSYERKHVLPEFPGKYSNAEEREDLQESVEHEEDDAVELIGFSYDNAYKPREPEKPVFRSVPKAETPLVDELKKKQGCFPLVAGFIAVCVLLSGGLFAGDTLTMILNIVILGACGFIGFSYYKKYKSAKSADEEVTRMTISSYELDKKEKEEKYKQALSVYQDKMVKYEQQKAVFINEYTAWRDIYLKCLAEEEEIEEKLENDRILGVNEIYKEKYVPAQKALEDKNDLIAEEYLPVLDDIINLLETNRADDLKEAINLYEEIAYRERQLELQREIEAQRQYEEELRRQDEERRYRQEVERREKEEQQRRYEEEKREREAERRHKEEMDLMQRQERDRMLEERRRSEEERRKKDREELARKTEEERERTRQCNSCALSGKCSLRRANCPSYIPR